MRIVRKIAMGLLAAVVLAVAGYLALALFVALVNATSSGQEEPTYNDDSLYDDYLNGQSHNGDEPLRDGVKRDMFSIATGLKYLP